MERLGGRGGHALALPQAGSVSNAPSPSLTVLCDAESIFALSIASSWSLYWTAKSMEFFCNNGISSQKFIAFL
jgi:hypothetical protein